MGQGRGIFGGNRRTESVSIIKANGERIEDIIALVQTEIIFIEDGTLDLEEGDIIVRILPSGAQQGFYVWDRGFMRRGIGGVGSHYQAKVRPLSQIDLEARYRASTIINIHGPHSKIYNQSVDQSVNYISQNIYPIFQEIKEIISNEPLDASEKAVLLDQVDAMSNAKDKDTYLSRYKDFIDSLASHATLLTCLAQYLPSLTGLL